LKRNALRILFWAIIASISCALSITSAASRAADQSPKFRDFPAEVFRGQKPPLKLSGNDLDYRTRYRALHRLPPNFAGHYAVSEVGCGTFCTFLLTIDLKTGKSAWLKVPSGEELYVCPEAYVDDRGEEIGRGILFRANSRLMVVFGKTASNECGVHYFEERNGEMILIRDVGLEKTR
jgi:hypothetical protein